MCILKKNDVILFQGDSITDCGRNREDFYDLGGGYPKIIGSVLSAKYPDYDLKFINKGVGGDRVIDLKERWQEDCIDLKPTVLSILIGINDCWRKFDNNDETTVADFEATYMKIADRAVNELNMQLIIMEPFVLPVPEDRRAWREDLDPKIQAARNVAEKYNGIYVPLDGLFASAYIAKNPAYFAEDGVHPTNAGHGLIANAWMAYAGM